MFGHTDHLRRARRPGVGALAFALCLAACGGGDGGLDSTAEASEPTVAGITEDREPDEPETNTDDSSTSTDDQALEVDEGSDASSDSSDNSDSSDDRSEQATDDDGSGRADVDAGADDLGSATTVPVTIEPPRPVPSTIPAATTGCEGAGFGEVQGETTTRVGVLVPDYSELIETGFVPRVTPAEYRTRYLASTFGANLRAESAIPGSPFELPCGELELVIATYDPIDPATQRDACLELADGPGVLVVLSELEDRRGDGLSCLIEEAGIPVLSAGSVTTADLEAAGGRLISLRPPVDILGRSATRTFDALGLLAGQKVAVIGGDATVSSAASEAVLSELDTLGITATSVVLSDSAGITDVWSEIPAVAEDLAAEQVTVVISVFDALVNNALWDRMIEQEASWQFLLVDAMGIAEHDKVTRLPDEFNGIVATTLESEKEADRSDPASVECIADYARLVELLEINPDATGIVGDPPAFALPDDVALPEDSVSPSTTVAQVVEPEPGEIGDDPLGVAREVDDADEEEVEGSDDGIETALREVLGEDRPPGPACALASTAIRAILAAGADLTTATFVEALGGLGPVDVFIEGTGELTPQKYYVADFIQALGFVRYEEPINEELAAPCDSPDNCWRLLDNPASGVTPIEGSEEDE